MTQIFLLTEMSLRVCRTALTSDVSAESLFYLNVYMQGHIQILS